MIPHKDNIYIINYLRFRTVYNKKSYIKKTRLCKKLPTNPKTMN